MGLCLGGLENPITEKVSEDGFNDKLLFGASSMQGWREKQEDAHNCILDFDENISYFAVYDGHGGHEVAEYCAENLPNFIKNSDEYKSGNYTDALIESFLRFDATIITEPVLQILKESAEKAEPVISDEEDEEDVVKNLYEEATMPLEEVIQKYKRTCDSSKEKSSEPSTSSSPVKDKNMAASSSSEAYCSGSASSAVEPEEEPCSSSASSSSVPKNESSAEPHNGEKSVSSSMDVVEEASSTVESSSKSHNGEVLESSPSPKTVASNPSLENGTISKKGKGKARITPIRLPSSPRTRPKRDPKTLYEQCINNVEISDSSSEESDDETFEASNVDASSDDDDGVNVAVEVGSSGESSAEEEDEDEQEETNDYLDSDEDESTKVPGYISGCTAVVALIVGKQLYVANAGDSRCIISRGGKAIPMSIDHSPYLEVETKRIKKAGGSINQEGRVNNGLNLSRAIGDHTYKTKKELSAREQAITSLPDVKTITLEDRDEFMVVACDGIWECMESQTLVNVIRKDVMESKGNLSTILETVFDSNLATNWGGKGCDNMTAIIVKFKHTESMKRNTSSEESNPKKAKTEDTSEAQTPAPV